MKMYLFSRLSILLLALYSGNMSAHSAYVASLVHHRPCAVAAAASRPSKDSGSKSRDLSAIPSSKHCDHPMARNIGMAAGAPVALSAGFLTFISVSSIIWGTSERAFGPQYGLYVGAPAGVVIATPLAALATCLTLAGGQRYAESIAHRWQRCNFPYGKSK
jgi:hypothetical protein